MARSPHGETELSQVIRIIAAHRDHFVRRLSVHLCVGLSVQ